MRLASALISTLLLAGACTRETDKSPAPAPPEPTQHRESEAAAPIPPVRTFAAPVPSSAADAAHAFAQMRTLKRSLEDHRLVRFTPIEDPSGKALRSFHTALRRLEHDDASGQKVRVAVYGSSSVAADRYTGYLRAYLQQRFGDGGVGFVSLVPLWRWHRHNEVRVSASSGWTIEHAQKERTGRLDGHYGLLGASAHTDSKRAHALLEPARGGVTDAAASDVVELYYLAQPKGGRFGIEVGGNRAAVVATRSGEHQAAYHRLAVQGEPVPLRVQPLGDGEVRLFGAVLERERPGVVVDELGIGGTRATNLVNWTEAIWADNLRRRGPQLYILAYGANEAHDSDEVLPIETYRAQLAEVLDRFAKVLPAASCVLVGPQDFPMRSDDDLWVRRPRVDAIVEAQREISAAKGCGFFDTRAMMGGPDQMVAWVAADPALAKPDHLHLTPLGYTHMGRVLADALMAPYDASD